MASTIHWILKVTPVTKHWARGHEVYTRAFQSSTPDREECSSHLTYKEIICGDRWIGCRACLDTLVAMRRLSAPLFQSVVSHITATPEYYFNNLLHPSTQCLSSLTLNHPEAGVTVPSITLEDKCVALSYVTKV